MTSSSMTLPTRATKSDYPINRVCRGTGAIAVERSSHNKVGAFEIDVIKLLESRISPSLEGVMRGCFLSTKFYCA